MAYQYLKSNPKDEMGKRFEGLFKLTRTSRKLPRLFKSVNELLALRTLLQSHGDPYTTLIDAVGKVGFANYWFFDNLLFLEQAKFITFQPDHSISYWSNFGWTIGNLSKVIVGLLKLQENFEKESKLRSKTSGDEKDGDRLKVDLAVLRAARTKLLLNVLASFLDTLVSSNGIQWPHKVLGQGLNDGVLGFCGSLSALITGYYRWKEVNK